MADAERLNETIDAISNSNTKSIGEQPDILANLELANQIANINLVQQQALAVQQAMLQLTLATVAKCVGAITAIDPSNPGAAAQTAQFVEIINKLTGMAATKQGCT